MLGVASDETYAGNDTLNGGRGDDVLLGGRGADTIEGGSGSDTLIYRSAADSKGATFDTVVGFNAHADHFDVPSAVIAIDAHILHGRLSNANFDANLASAVDAARLGAHHAVLFTPDAGRHSGELFLIVDVNGHTGYQAGEDLVIRLDGGRHLGDLDVGDFI